MTYCPPAPSQIAMWTLHWTRGGGRLPGHLSTPTARARCHPSNSNCARADAQRVLISKTTSFYTRHQTHPPHKARPDNSCHARGPHTGVEPSRRMHGATERATLACVRAARTHTANNRIASASFPRSARVQRCFSVGVGKLPGQEKANRHWIGALHAAARTGCISRTCGFPRVRFGAIQAILCCPPRIKNKGGFAACVTAGGMYSISFRRMLLRGLVISRKLVCGNLALHVVTHGGTDVLGDKCEPGNLTVSKEWMGMHGGHHQQASDSAGVLLYCTVVYIL